MCYKCAGNHDGNTCNSQVKRCINCSDANKKLNKQRPTDHWCDDVINCETYKVKWEQAVRGMNYPWKPDAPWRKNLKE